MKKKGICICFIIGLIFSLNGCKSIVKEKESTNVTSAVKPTIATALPQNTQTPIVKPTPIKTPVPTLIPTQKSKLTTPIPTKKVSSSALSNVRYGYGMKRVKGKAPEVSGKYLTYFTKYNAYYIGNTNSKDLYLTFDEGYENGYSGKILDALKANNVKACFFITMPYLRENFDLVKRMVDEGHEVGNHTVNHPSMPEITDDKKLEEELLVLDREFYEKTGKSMSFLRPPKGEFSERTLAISNSLGYKTVFWSFAYVDWEVNNQKGADYAYNNFMEYIHGGCVILLHAVSKDNAEAMDRMIKGAKNEGYVFKSLKDIN